MSPQIDAIVLAAGLSTRTGERNKLLLPLAGKPLIAHAVEAALGSLACTVHVVTGHQSDQVATALNDYTVNFVHNPNFSEGMSSSIKSGIRALPTDLDGVVLCLGDMPLVVSDHLDLLIKNFSAAVACAPYYKERRGHPVLFPRSMFSALLQLSGATGARDLLEQLESTILQIDVNDEGIFFNVNRPADL